MLLLKGPSETPTADQLGFATQPGNKAAGEANQVVARAYAANGATPVPSWSGAGTLAISAGTPNARTVAVFNPANLEYLNGGDNPALEFTGDFTLFAWWKLTSAAALGVVFGKWIAAGNEREYILYYDNAANRIRFGQSRDGNNNLLLSDASLGAPSLGVWYFTVCKYEHGVGLSIATNRRAASTTPQTAGHAKGNAVFQVGAGDTTGGLLWNGQIGLVGMAPSLLSSAVLDDLYNGGRTPFATEFDPATIAACKQSGGDDGDLLFMLDEASGNRVSYSGNYSLTDVNTVASAGSGESVNHANVSIESGSTASSTAGGLLTFEPKIGRPGTGYKLTVTDDAESLTGAQSDAFNVT